MAQIASNGSVTLHSAVSTLPALTDYTGGASLTSLEAGHVLPGTGGDSVRALPETAVLYIRPEEGATVAIPGPVEMYAGFDGQWYLVGELDGGAEEIEVSEFAGFCERVYL